MQNTQKESPPTRSETSQKSPGASPDVLQAERAVLQEKGASFLLLSRKPETLEQGAWEKDMKEAVKVALEPLPRVDLPRDLGLQTAKFYAERQQVTESQRTVIKHIELIMRNEMGPKKLLQEIVDYNNTHNKNADKTVPDPKVDADLQSMTIRNEKTKKDMIHNKLAPFKFDSAVKAKPYLDALNKGEENLRVTMRRDLAVYLAQRSEFLKKYRRTTDNMPMAAKDAVNDEDDIPNFLSNLVPLNARERALLSYMERVALPMQHTIAQKEKLGLSPSRISADANFLLTIALQKRLSVETAIAYTTIAEAEGDQPRSSAGEAIVTRFLDECGYPAENHPEYTAAAKLILRYIGKYQSAIQAAAKEASVPVDSLTITEALELAGNESTVLKLADSFIQSGGKLTLDGFEAIVKQTIEEKKDKASVQQVLIPASTYGPKLEEARKKNPQATVSDVMNEYEQNQYIIDVQNVEDFMLRKHANLKVSHMRKDREDPVIQENLLDEQRHILRVICQDAQTEETYRICREALQNKSTGLTEWFSDKLIGDIGPKTDAALKDIILGGNMSVKDAFELYYILKSAETTGRGVGTFALRLKALSLLKNGYAPLAEEWTGAMSSELTMAARSKSLEVASLLSKYGLSQEQMEDMQDVLLTLQEKGFSHGEGWVKSAIRAWGKDPMFWSVMGAIGAAAGVGTIWKASQLGAGAVDMQYTSRMILPHIRTFALQKDLGQLLRTLQAENPNLTMAQLENMQREVRSLYEGRTSFVYRLPSRVRSIRLARTFLINRGETLDTLAKAIYTKPGSATTWTQKMLGLQMYTDVDDVTRKLLAVAPGDEAGVQKALQSIGQTEADAQASLNRVLRGAVKPAFEGNPTDAKSFDTSSNVSLPESAAQVTLSTEDLRLLESKTLSESDAQSLAGKLGIALESDGKTKSRAELEAAIRLKVKIRK